MCLVLFALGQNPEWPLVLIANRDEFYERPAKQAHFWEESPDLLAGQDLLAGGTWTGIRKKGLRFAILTNYRDSLPPRPENASRGRIVRDYLESDDTPTVFLENLKKNRENYNPFNLICGTPEELFCFSSTQDSYQKILPGIHGLSNHLLDTPWPKVKRGCGFLEQAIRKDISEEKLISILRDQHRPEDTDLPDTGVGLGWERKLAPIFVHSPEYGTRCSTLLLYDQRRNISFTEVSWDEKGDEAGKVKVEWKGSGCLPSG